MLSAWIVGSEQEPQLLGTLEAPNLDAAFDGARRMCGPIGLGMALCLMPVGHRPPTPADRERAQFKARLWRSSDNRRVNEHVYHRRLKKQRRKPS